MAVGLNVFLVMTALETKHVLGINVSTLVQEHVARMLNVLL